nr:CD8 alpha [Lateolabrax maculatus]
MDQKWIHILVILVFYQKITSGAGEETVVKEGEAVDILCSPGEVSTLIVWFRMLDTSGMDFIATFTKHGMTKATATHYSSKFNDAKIQQNILTLKSFNKARDIGTYCCATLYKGVELRFGKVTRLVGEKKVEVAVRAPVTTTTTTKQNLCTTGPACVCNTDKHQVETTPSLSCTPIILGPLAGGCGLLLLLLIISTLYCNKIRTKRCPHHYKRKLRTMPPGKQTMTNRPI